MTLLHWKSEYSVGVASVDYEHQQLIQMINDLAGELADDDGASAGTTDVEAFLGELLSTISAHFALEERVMARADYPEFLSHKADHEALLEQIRSMMDQFTADPQRGRKLLQESLGAWFAEHFSTFDARLHNTLGQ